MVNIRKHYDPAMPVRISFGPGLTEQAHKKECDVNLIVKRAMKGGAVNQRTDGFFADVSAFNGSYFEMMNQVLSARDSFMQLRSDIRKRFDNDPGKFLDFVSNPENHDELVALGLANSRDVEAPPDPAAPPGEETTEE